MIVVDIGILKTEVLFQKKNSIMNKYVHENDAKLHFVTFSFVIMCVFPHVFLHSRRICLLFSFRLSEKGEGFRP